MSPAPRHGKWYNDACGTAFALEVVGERWSLLIVRELMFGGLRFSDIRASLPGISAKVLTERLEGLESSGVLRRRMLSPPSSARLYELTEWGLMAEPLMQELGRWAARSPAHDAALPLSPVSLMLSLRTMLDTDAARQFDAVIGFIIGNDSFLASLEAGELTIRREKTDSAAAVFSAPAAPVLAAFFYGGVPREELEQGAALHIEGDDALALRFAGLFRLPPKIE